jgi:hypothetical protein
MSKILSKILIGLGFIVFTVGISFTIFTSRWFSNTELILIYAAGILSTLMSSSFLAVTGFAIEHLKNLDDYVYFIARQINAGRCINMNDANNNEGCPQCGWRE